MSDLRLLCVKTKKCGWVGLESELVRVPRKRTPTVQDSTCPKCGGKSFYRADDRRSK